MALINCSECGKQISSSATVCPNCGCKTELGKKKEGEKMNATKYIIIYGSALVFMLIGLVVWLSTSEHDRWSFYHGKDITVNVACAILLFAAGIILFVAGHIAQMKEKGSKF